MEPDRQVTPSGCSSPFSGSTSGGVWTDGFSVTLGVVANRKHSWSFLGSFFMLADFAGDAIKVKSQFVGQEGQLVASLHLAC